MGRPVILETAEQAQELIDLYFDGCEQEEVVPTVNGLCLALGMTRETLRQYAEKPEFSDTVKTARMRLEMAWEQRLAGPNAAGTIFWLKNQGWTDRLELEHSGAIETASDDQIDARLTALLAKREGTDA